jgi:hypothetical protein
MLTLRDKDKYFNEVFRKSLLIALIVLTILFYFFPRFAKLPEIEKQPLKIDIYVSDIPQTKQKSRVNPPPPARPYGIIPVPSEEADFPEELSLNTMPGTGQTNLPAPGLAPEVPAKPLLEVYPSVSGVTCKGYIRLLLLVNTYGQTESIEILENTTGTDTCLTLVKQAVSKSQWIPAKVGNKPVNSWVVKTYTFNTEK